MGMRAADLDYIDNPAAPTYRAHGLHDLDFIGSGDGLFTLFQFKKTSGGVWYRETAFFIEMPTVAIGPAVALVTRKLSGSLLGPIQEVLCRIGVH